MAVILVVDDEVDGTAAVVQMLEGSGHTVRVARDGEQAMAAVSSAKPDLILLDVMMPRMDGLAFLKVLRSYLGWQDVPVVLLTAYAEEPKVREAIQHGARAVLSKGQTSLTEIRERVDAELNRTG